MGEIVAEHWGRTNIADVQDYGRVTEFGVSTEMSASRSVGNIEFVSMLKSVTANHIKRIHSCHLSSRGWIRVECSFSPVCPQTNSNTAVN
jgi:hypothetical protein